MTIRFTFSRPPDARVLPQTGRLFTSAAYRDTFAQHGLVWDDARPDVLFCVHPGDDVIRGSTPFLVCAREPSCDFTNSLLRDGSFWADDVTPLLESPALLGVLKERRFANASMLDGPRLDGRWHNNVLLEDYRRLQQRDDGVETFLSHAVRHEYSETQKQVHERSVHALWDFHFSPLNALLDTLSRAPWSTLARLRHTRVVDVYCSLKTHSRFRRFALVAWHRARCLEQLGRLSHRRCVAGVTMSEGRRYLLRLLTAKISVSPWGAGAWCIRDIESILAGCVTIKPPCPWVDMVGFDDLYDPTAGYFVTLSQ